MNRAGVAQFFRFAAVGAGGTLLHYLVLILLVTGFAFWPVVGAALGAAAGALANYWLNRAYTFRSRRNHREALPLPCCRRDRPCLECTADEPLHSAGAALPCRASHCHDPDSHVELFGESCMDISKNQRLTPPRSGMRGTASISVIVPAYNEEDVLPVFYRRATEVLRNLGASYEIVFVNDGSSDGTLRLLLQMSESDPNVMVIDLSRNFGKEVALTAGLDQSCGDVVVVIDADLQDPPEMIPQFVDAWREGYDVVYAVRTDREGETWVKKATAQAFYRVIRAVSRINIPKNTGDFRLMSRRAVEALGRLREHHRFMKGLFAWVGFPSKPIYYKRAPRAAGETKWNYWKLWNFALEGITAFTIAPLKIATYFGLGVAATAFFYAAYVIYKTLRYGDPVQGYPSLVVIVLFLGGVQLVFTGILGEYLGRVFNEVKQRPLYVLNSIYPSQLRTQCSYSTECASASGSIDSIPRSCSPQDPKTSINTAVGI